MPWGHCGCPARSIHSRNPAPSAHQQPDRSEHQEAAEQGQHELGRTPLLKTYPPGEPIPLTFHVLGMASGLLALFFQR